MIAVASASPTLTPTVGYQQHQLLDQHQTPVQYMGNQGTVGARLDAAGPRSRAWLSVQAYLGATSAPSHGDRGLGVTPAVGGAAEVVWMGRLATMGGTRLWLGAGGRKGLDIVSGTPMYPWLLGLASADAHVALDREIGDAQLLLDVSVPVVGLIARHNWSLAPVLPGRGDITAFYVLNTRGVTFMDMPAVRASARLTGRLGERMKWVAHVEGAYLTHADPAPLRFLTWGLRAGLSFALGRSS